MSATADTPRARDVSTVVFVDGEPLSLVPGAEIVGSVRRERPRDPGGAGRVTQSSGSGCAADAVYVASVEYWKPHSLASPHEGQIDLRLGDRVRTTAEMHGVPLHTEGRVILANGFNWQRYRVLFDNGVEVGDLDHRNLEPVGRAARRLKRTAKRAARQ